MKLSIIIVNYNVRYFLEQCLLSVRAALQQVEGEVWVVDNASTDGSRDFLEPRFPDVHFIWNSENTGFGRACNQALQQAKGRYVLFLNPDTIVPENCFQTCIAFFESHAHAGALGIRMLDGKGQFLPESKRAFPAPLTSFYKLSGLAALFPRSRIFARYHLGHLSETENHPIEVMAGAFLMVRKPLLDATGGFDESFFMYGEDVDLSYRLQQQPHPAGGTYRNYYCSNSSILHFKGESTRKGSLNYVRLFYQAMSCFVQKHYASAGAGLLVGGIQLAIALRALLSVLRRFVQRMGLPLLDAVLLFLMYWLAKEVWTTWVRPEQVYEKQLLHISFTGFSLLFLLVSFYTGLYQSRYRFKNLLYSSVVSLIIILAVYALLPETVRFSRGIVVLGSLLSFGILALWRKLLLWMQVLTPAEADDESYTLVVGTASDFAAVEALASRSGSSRHLRGFVSPITEAHSLGKPAELPTILDNTPTQELIICTGQYLSFVQVVQLYQQFGKRVRLRLHAAGSGSIVGSDSKNDAGETIGGAAYPLAQPVNRRLKRLLDVTTALLLLITAPIHLVLNRHPLQLLLHCWQVLLAQKTWVGYQGMARNLPPLRPAVLGPAGSSHSSKALNEEGQQQANAWYAQEYELLHDVAIVVRHYQNLGIK